MGKNLDEALSGVLGRAISPKEVVTPRVYKALGADNLGELALQHYNKAKDYLRQGNWAEYGNELENLEKVLRDMARITKEEKK